MKLSLFPLLASLLAVAFAYEDEDRMLGPFGGRGGMRGGGLGGGRPPFPPPDPEVELTCSSDAIECTPRRPGGTFDEDSGIRVCLQHPQDETKNMTVCMPATEGVTMVFSDDDTCGCCGGQCPASCADTDTACACTDTNRDDIEFDGYDMTMTRKGWFGGDVTITTCVPTEATVDAQLRGAECVKGCS
mmetsp:Transcript_44833/g.43425  ORF Transcript_44833/g.43425 Transcript_44833/m.43425 type:complete len:188 (-) Transcript_44833:131-694(-)